MINFPPIKQVHLIKFWILDNNIIVIMNILALVFTACLLGLGVHAHPTDYPDFVYRNVSCYNPAPPKINSYHMHMLYIGNNDK